MLYVFRVDTGTMMHFDMSLAVNSVANLQQHIEKVCRLPPSSQVLLVSGGQVLDQNSRVCSFSAGTDTNPIFLFTKSLKETSHPHSSASDCGPEFDLTEKVREAQNQKESFETLRQRASLAQQFYDLAKEQARTCENLVHDQHLQQQGWAAVIANLEDLRSDFKKRSERYVKTYQDFYNDYDSYLSFLQSFYDDLTILEKIPVLPVLLPEFEGEQTSEPSENADTASKPSKLTLLDWIKATDKKSTMDGIFEHCAKGLEQFNKNTLNELKLEIDKTVDGVDNNEMKEVKGLGDRLYGLEQLMLEAKRYVSEQGEQAQAFLQNAQRATNIGDTSVLPDLCSSQQKQLLVMLKNHQQLCDIRRRCVRAKEELSSNLFHRLKWVMYIESVMLDTDHRLSNCHENIQVIRRHLEILRQIHVCPATYLSAVAEVVRRRAFSQAFLTWASELACHLLTIHNEEVTRRKEFQSTFEGHFLNSLFPGMKDLPPAYGTQAPTMFDTSLPKLTEEDIEKLKQEIPELEEFLKVPELSPTINNLIFAKSAVKSDTDKVDDMGVEEKLVQVVQEVGLASNLDQTFLKANDSETCLAAHLLPHLKDLDRGCESETDTEEFEKVCPSPLDLHFDKDIPSPRPGTQDASTLTEDNLQTSRHEHDRLKSLLSNMALLSRQTIQQLKSELDQMKSFFISEKSNIEIQYESLSNSWENLTLERDNKERVIIQRLTSDHESEMQDFKRLTEQKDEEVKQLQLENICLEQGVKVAHEDKLILRDQLAILKNNLETSNIRIEELSNQISVFEKEKEKCIKDVSDRLNREHRAEMENIRARYRFMTMERSPSESSLEKVDRQDKDRESLIRQIRESCDKEKDEALKESMAREASKWQGILEQKLSEMKAKYEFERDNLIDEVTKRITEDKDKQIELLRERHANLILENMKFKDTIQQLAECEVSQNVNDLLEKVELLEREKCQLEAELSMERSRRLEEMPQDMGASVAVYEGKVDAATSPIRHKERLTKSQTSLIKSGHLSIETCSIGDSVLVIWNPTYENYTILQESSSLYFLHADCLEQLGLKKVEHEERKMYCTGEVYDKEYCHAKKTENRYKVKKGTKFYRVKVKPLTPKEARHSQHSSHMSQSQTAGPTIPENRSTDISASHSLPSTPTKLTSQLSTKSSSKIQKPDTETLVMQTSRLMNQSANLLKEIQKNIPVSAIDTSQILVQSTSVIAETIEEATAKEEILFATQTSTSTDTVIPDTSAEASATDSQPQEDNSDSIPSDADSMNKSDSASNR